MNISMRLTMDGLIKSLKGFVHDLADELEYGGRDLLRRHEPDVPEARSRPARSTERLSDESSR